MEQRLSLVTLGVADVAQSRRFYEQLGWRASSASSESIVFFQLGGIALALYGRTALAQDACLPSEGSGFGGITLAHNVRTREEVDAVYAARGRQVREFSSPPRMPSGAATPATSPIQTATRGRSPGTRTSRCGTTAVCSYRNDPQGTPSFEPPSSKLARYPGSGLLFRHATVC